MEGYSPRPPVLTPQLFAPRLTACELTTGAQDDRCESGLRLLPSTGLQGTGKGADHLTVTCSLPPPPTPLPCQLLLHQLPSVRSGANSEWESERGSAGREKWWDWTVKWECWRGKDSPRCNSGLVSCHSLSQRPTTVHGLRGQRERLGTERVRGDLENN